MDEMMRRMGTEAAEVACRWLREAETCYGLAGYGGVVEMLHRCRVEIESAPLLVGERVRRLVTVDA